MHALKKVSTFFTILAVCLSAMTVFAADITFEATVNANKVALGSSLQLTLTVTGAKPNGPIQLPPIDGLDSRYMGPSTRVTIINGQYSKSISYLYSLIPLKVGHFKIPSFQFTMDKNVYTSAEIEVEVVGSQSVATSSQTTAEGGLASLKDRFFVSIEVPKQEVFIQEKIPLTIKLHVNDLRVRGIDFPEFSHIGFLADGFPQPQQHQSIIGGVRFHVVKFTTSVYPTRTGELALGPAEMTCTILVENQKKRGQTRSFGSIFNDFFESYQNYDVSLKSAVLPIEVKPLPKKGKPKDFSGGVGQFDLRVSASPLEIKAGDPITLTVEVSGSGNLKAVQMPKVNVGKDFKTFEPQVKEEKGVKRLEQVLIPLSSDIKEIPAVHFSFFDPQKQEYQTLKKKPIPITVLKPKEGEEFRIIGLTEQGTTYRQEIFGEDLIYIKDAPGQWVKTGTYLYKRKALLFLLITFLVGWVTLLIVYRRTHKIQTDAVYRRRLYAPRGAKKGLRRARKHFEKKELNEFYDAIFKTLQEYLSHKFHLAGGAVTSDAIEGLLKVKGIQSQVLDKIKSILSECDMVRYAASQFNEINMQSTLRKAEEVIDFLERYKR